MGVQWPTGPPIVCFFCFLQWFLIGQGVNLWFSLVFFGFCWILLNRTLGAWQIWTLSLELGRWRKRARESEREREREREGERQRDIRARTEIANPFWYLIYIPIVCLAISWFYLSIYRSYYPSVSLLFSVTNRERQKEIESVRDNNVEEKPKRDTESSSTLIYLCLSFSLSLSLSLSLCTISLVSLRKKVRERGSEHIVELVEGTIEQR